MTGAADKSFKEGDTTMFSRLLLWGIATLLTSQAHATSFKCTAKDSPHNKQFTTLIVQDVNLRSEGDSLKLSGSIKLDGKRTLKDVNGTVSKGKKVFEAKDGKYTVKVFHTPYEEGTDRVEIYPTGNAYDNTIQQLVDCEEISDSAEKQKAEADAERKKEEAEKAAAEKAKVPELSAADKKILDTCTYLKKDRSQNVFREFVGQPKKIDQAPNDPDGENTTWFYDDITVKFFSKAATEVTLSGKYKELCKESK